MKTLFQFLITALACFTFHGMIGQQWTSDLQDGTNIYEVQQSFEEHWGDQPYIKGRGYKQFQRWFNFWEPRLYPSGEWGNLKEQAHLDGIRHASKSSSRDGGNWEPLGLDDWNSTSYSPGNGRVNCIAFDPSDDQIIYVGTPAGGLWKSSNAGQDWIPMTDHLPTLGVSAILIREDNPEVIYIATGDSDGFDTYSLGIFKSEDGGDTWGTAGLTFTLGENVRTHRLMSVEGSPDIMFAATSDGLYKTTNGGITWLLIINANIRDLEFKPGDSSVMYATSTSFYKSTDGGDSFSIISNGLPSPGILERTSVAVTPADPNFIYLIACEDENNSFEGLYRSTDAGENWELRSNSPNLLTSDENGNSSWGQGWYDMEIAVSPTDANRVMVGGVNLWQSTNGGSSWNLNALWTWPPSGNNYVHADIHHLEYHDGLLWCGSDGGIFRSSNQGGSFTDLSEGLSISQFYRLGVFAGNSSRVSCGAQDNGTNLMVGENWTHVLGADGMETIIHPTDQNIMWASTQNGGLNKSTDGGANFSWSASGISDDGAWTTPYILSPANPDIMYAGYENVWRSADGGDSWASISDFNDESLRSVAMGLIDPNTIYAASYDNLYRTNNAGGDWENVSTGLSNQAITYLAVDPLDVNRIWATFSGFVDGEKVYYSDNGGELWQNISDNLPNCPINCIVRDNESNDGLYVGTDLGVYHRSDLLSSWHPFMDGLPNVIVNELEINYDDGKIFAATFGRGLWSSDLWQSPAEAPVVGIDMETHYICKGNSVQFMDVSQEAAPGWFWTFEGGNPATSTEQNPEISYAEAGTYDVTLEVANTAGSSSFTCTDCVIVHDTAGLELPLNEGFESGVDLADLGWHAVNDSEGNGWQITDAAGFQSDHSIWIDNYSLDVENVYELISDPYDLSNVPDGDNVYFRIDYAYANLVDESQDRMRLYLSTNCADSWSLKEQWTTEELATAAPSISAFVPTALSDWTEYTYEISAADMQESVAFRLWFRNENGNNVYVDNINIWSGETHIGELESIQSLVVFPNPFEGSSTVKIHSVVAQKASMRILDQAGRIVTEEELNIQAGETNHQLNLDQFPAGVYQLELINSNGRITEKLVRY